MGTCKNCGRKTIVGTNGRSARVTHVFKRHGRTYSDLFCGIGSMTATNEEVAPAGRLS